MHHRFHSTALTSVLLVSALAITLGLAAYHKRLTKQSLSSPNINSPVPPELELPAQEGGGPPANQGLQKDNNATTPVFANSNWQICKNTDFGFTLSYPAEWHVWERGPGEDIPSSCESDAAYRFFGPDIYSGIRPPQLALAIYASTTSDTIYLGNANLTKTLLKELSNTFGPVTKLTSTRDGTALAWFADNQGAIVVASHAGRFFEFRSQGLDSVTLQGIMTSLVFGTP
jgi:hypothetical protein